MIYCSRSPFYGANFFLDLFPLTILSKIHVSKQCVYHYKKWNTIMTWQWIISLWYYSHYGLQYGSILKNQVDVVLHTDMKIKHTILAHYIFSPCITWNDIKQYGIWYKIYVYFLVYLWVHISTSPMKLSHSLLDSDRFLKKCL